MKELLERLEARSAGKAKADKSKAMHKRGTVYSETDVAVTVKLSSKEMGRLIRAKTLTVKARDANKEPNTYSVTIELGGRGVSAT